jgi:hypothetical protein
VGAHNKDFSVLTPYPSVRSSSPNSVIMGYQVDSLLSGLRTTPGALSSLPQTILDILWLCVVYSTRISEVLSLSTADYIGQGRYLCRGKKRSRDISVYIGHDPDYFTGHGAIPSPTHLFPVGYYTVRRWCVRAGIGFLPRGHKNVARTHAHRYYTADAVARISSPSSVTCVLHHNSSRSREHYLERAG